MAPRDTCHTTTLLEFPGACSGDVPSTCGTTRTTGPASPCPECGRGARGSGVAAPIRRPAPLGLQVLRAEQRPLQDRTPEPKPAPLTGSSITVAWKSATLAAGLDGLWFHDLRRTWATLAEEGGADIHEVSKGLRHSDVKVTERYAQVGLDRLRATMDRVSVLHSATKSGSKAVADTKTARRE